MQRQKEIPRQRVLIVEDYEGFRRLLRQELEEMASVEVVGEATDGQEAIAKAQELAPDLILLDIGLPKLNGLAAAKLIHKLVPTAKLLFISQEMSPDVAREAFRLGGLGYIHKASLWRDLLPGVEAVLAGSRFLSRNIEFGIEPTSAARHEVLFYATEQAFRERMTRFVAEAFDKGNLVVSLVTNAHLENLIQDLKERGFDTDRAIQQGTFVPLDPLAILSTIMVDGMPDRERYFGGLETLIETAAKSSTTAHARLAICGEAAVFLFKAGNINGAIQIEKLSAEFIKNHNVDILCAYPMPLDQSQQDSGAFSDICAEHTTVSLG